MKRKSTAGLTVDFPMLNVLGFMCYTTSTAAFLFNAQVRAQYAVRHPSAPRPTVRVNDFAFALHALVMCIVTISQFWSRLWGFRELRGKRASRIAVGIFWGSLVGIALVALTVWTRGDDASHPEAWASIDVVRRIRLTAVADQPLTPESLTGIRDVLREAACDRRQIHPASVAELQSQVNERLVHCAGTDGHSGRWA